MPENTKSQDEDPVDKDAKDATGEASRDAAGLLNAAEKEAKTGGRTDPNATSGLKVGPAIPS
jgi:hypothetical protein